MKVAESEGTVKQYTVEMTVPQFQVTAMHYSIVERTLLEFVSFFFSELFFTTKRNG